ncbi:hypothetical protein B0H14DRAFT_2628990 [Mycena olivaceomarginata]|nr:hypothetical protein B0H14DRAFT_2628990 [Mycena olivaceomarginata]
MFERFLKVSIGNNSEIVFFCLQRLADISCRIALNQMSDWGNSAPGVFLAFALEGFTVIDVHRSRAECMLQLGDISNKHGNQLEAADLWEKAQPLFERSSQAKQVEEIAKQLSSVGNDVLEQYQENLARLTELNAPSRKVEEWEDDLSDIEESQNGELDAVKWLDPVAV